MLSCRFFDYYTARRLPDTLSAGTAPPVPPRARRLPGPICGAQPPHRRSTQLPFTTFTDRFGATATDISAVHAWADNSLCFSRILQGVRSGLKTISSQCLTAQVPSRLRHWHAFRVPRWLARKRVPQRWSGGWIRLSARREKSRRKSSFWLAIIPVASDNCHAFVRNLPLNLTPFFPMHLFCAFRRSLCVSFCGPGRDAEGLHERCSCRASRQINAGPLCVARLEAEKDPVGQPRNAP